MQLHWPFLLRMVTNFLLIGYPYKKIELPDSNVIEVESVNDSDNNKWYEVPYLAQETVFQEISNTTLTDPNLSKFSETAPYLLKLQKTSKRFITRTNSDNLTELVFGSGVSTSPDELIVPNPENVGNNTSAGISKLDRAFDPSNFLQTKSYGQAPSNTILTVNYKVGGGQKSNVAPQSINSVARASWKDASDTLDYGIYQSVKTSLAVSNPEAAQGGSSSETISEIKRNALAHFQGQNRIVTKEDYIGRTYAMPARYGNIAKAYVASDTSLNINQQTGKSAVEGMYTRTEDGGYEKITAEHLEDPAARSKFNIQNPNATNLYLLGYDGQKKLTQVNEAVKQNLKTYLTPYRMLTDAINIKDGFIINIGVEFSIVPLSKKNSNEVLLRCIETIKNYFNIDNRQFNEPIMISDLMTTIADVEGVQSVEKVRIKNKWRASRGYSGIRYDIDAATKNNIIYPSVDPSIFELKNPSVDIKGKIMIY